jgi:hypothetical protein
MIESFDRPQAPALAEPHGRQCRLRDLDPRIGRGALQLVQEGGRVRQFQQQMEERLKREAEQRRQDREQS